MDPISHFRERLFKLNQILSLISCIEILKISKLNRDFGEVSHSKIGLSLISSIKTDKFQNEFYVHIYYSLIYMKRPPPELSETAKNISAAIFFYNPTTFYDIQAWCRRKMVPRAIF